MFAFTPKLTLAAVIITGSISLMVSSEVAPKLHKTKFWPHASYSSIGVGDYAYKVEYVHNSLGSVSFPENDAKGKRIMTLPDASFGEDQVKQSLLHEELHACMHNHDHDYLTPQMLKDHLQKKLYTEEDVVEMIAPCLLALKQKEMNGSNGLF